MAQELFTMLEFDYSTPVGCGKDVCDNIFSKEMHFESFYAYMNKFKLYYILSKPRY